MKIPLIEKFLISFLIIYFVLLTQNLPIGTAEDEGAHSMDSFFYYTFFKDFIVKPNIIFNLENYVYKFYVYYPSLYIIYYPPLFGILSAFLFFIFGVNLLVTRLISMIFSILSLTCLYYLGKEFYNKKVAIFSIIILAFAPYFFIYSQLAMLDISLLFFILLSILLFYKAAEKNKRKYFYYLGVVMGVGFLIKYTIILLGVPFLIYLIYKKDFKKNLNPLIIASIIFLLISSPYLIVLFFFQGFDTILWALNYGFKNFSFLEHLYFYPMIIFYEVCPLVFLIPILFLFKKRKLKKESKFIFLIIASYFVVSTIITNKTPKYIIPVIPLFSLLFVNDLIKRKILFLVIFSIVFIYQFTISMLPPYYTIQNEISLKTDTAPASEYMNKNIVENGNIFFTPFQNEAGFIFNFAKNNNFKTHVFRWRWCIFDNMTVEEFKNYINKNNIYYIAINLEDKRYLTFKEWIDVNFQRVFTQKHIEIYQNKRNQFDKLTSICDYNCNIKKEICYQLD